MSPVETTAKSLSDVLHRALSASDAGRCWLLIDPSVRPLEPEDELAALLQAAGVKATLAHRPDRRVAAGDLPALVALDSNRGADSAVLAASIDEGLGELGPTSLARGNGRRIAGWLQSSASTEIVAEHIGRQMIQRRFGRTTLLRWIDPAALWAFWPVLDTLQQTKLLGPIGTYRFLDPGGRLTTLTGRGFAESSVTGALDLSAAQWADAVSIGALNAALRDWGASRAELPALAKAREVALAAMRRARARGYVRQVDLVAYARCALNFNARFDDHPLVQARLDAAEPGAYLDGVVNDLTEDDWRQISQGASNLYLA